MDLSKIPSDEDLTNASPHREAPDERQLITSSSSPGPSISKINEEDPAPVDQNDEHVGVDDPVGFAGTVSSPEPPMVDHVPVHEHVGNPMHNSWTWKVDVSNYPRHSDIYFNSFGAGGCTWGLKIRRDESDADNLGIFLILLEKSNSTKALKITAHCRFSITNQLNGELTVTKDSHNVFNETPIWGFESFMPLSEFYDPNKGYLLNGMCIVRFEILVQLTGYDSKIETGFVGIENQGRTCYLNSLLQALYHIPYFRKSVYQIPISDNDTPSRSFSLALQILFYKLQCSDSTVSTTDLTNSFGWPMYDSLIEHDAEELNRILCAELQCRMKGTVVERTLQQLFEGRTMSYVKCINVDYQSTRSEVFQDIKLDVQGCQDVYDSFEKFVESVKLCGDNKYRAEQHGLQDAQKVVLFVQFPPVLQLHLKRFLYDFAKDSMEKINDRYEFPLHLDLDRDDGKYLSPEADRRVRNLYTLHSVVVHGGGASHGHYYTFSQPDLSGKWFKFDDDRVTRQDINMALEGQYGGENKGSSAYMLFYIRESDKEKVICNINEKDITQRLRMSLKEEQEQESDDTQEEDLDYLPLPEKTKDDILLYFKLYDRENEEVMYVGHLWVKKTGKPIEILTELNERSNLSENEEIELYDEIMFGPKLLFTRIDKYLSFQSNNLEDGSIICYQKSTSINTDDEITYPDIHHFLEHVHNEMIVIFISMKMPKADFSLKLSKLHNYDKVVERVASHICFDDPTKIRLTSFDCSTRKPNSQPIKYRGVDTLLDMLVDGNQISGILHYEVLDIPLPELEHLKALKVVFYRSTMDEAKIHTIRLPKNSTVDDAINVLKMKVELSHPNAELRLLLVFDHKIHKILSSFEKIDADDYKYWTLRAEEIPEEEKNCGLNDLMIHVYHFNRSQGAVRNFGEPFILVIHRDETLGSVKTRVQKKLCISDNEFAKWKFACCNFDQHEYLQDADILTSHFLDSGVWLHLGLEHSENTPMEEVSHTAHVLLESGFKVLAEMLTKGNCNQWWLQIHWWEVFGLIELMKAIRQQWVHFSTHTTSHRKLLSVPIQ